MEQFDREKARRVWQRVQGTATPTIEPVQSHILAAENLHAYKKMIKTATEQQKVLLRQLITDSSRILQVLSGIQVMEKGEKAAFPVPSQEQNSREVLLRQCVGRTIQLAAYLGNVGENNPLFPAYRHLSQQLGGDLCALLALLAL